MIIKDRRKLGTLALVYILVLALDIVVGSALIVWKCSVSHLEEDCRTVTYGAIGSIIIWFVVLLVFPCVVTRCEICYTFESIKNTFINYWDKIYEKKPRQIHVQNEIYRPTTTTTTAALYNTDMTRFESRDTPCLNTDVNVNLLTSHPRGDSKGLQQNTYVFYQDENAENQGKLIKNLDHDDP